MPPLWPNRFLSILSTIVVWILELKTNCPEIVRNKNQKNRLKAKAITIQIPRGTDIPGSQGQGLRVASPFPGSLLESQTRRPLPRPLGSESAFQWQSPGDWVCGLSLESNGLGHCNRAARVPGEKICHLPPAAPYLDPSVSSLS